MPAVRAVKSKGETPFRAVLRDLERLARRGSLPIAIVGGLAAIKHGDPRETVDADILVGKEDLDRLISESSRHGFAVRRQSKSGWPNLVHKSTGIEVIVVPEGGRARDDAPTTIPGPRSVGVKNFGFANLAGFVELKLASYRQKDIAHVVEVLKRSESRQIAPVRRRIKAVHPVLARRFEEALAQTRMERRQERHRNG